jgi:DNA-binding SARP family transcriptional activator
LRWQQMVAQGVAERRTANDVVAAIQRDLLARLTQAAAALRAHMGLAVGGAWSTHALLLPVSVAPPVLSEREAGRSSLGGRLARWWRQLIQGEPDEPRTASVATLAPLPLAIPRLTGSPMATAEAPPPIVTAEAPPPIVTAEAPVTVEPPPSPPIITAPLTGDVPPPSAPAEALVLPPERVTARRGARLAVTCFGPFRVTIDDRTVERWESSRARTIFKYLVVRNAAPVSKELLAELFWPESEPDLARRSLHQAIYCLRQSLKRVAPDLTLIRFADDCYQISPEIGLWVDSEEFTRAIAEARARFASGAQEAAMAAYAMAADLAVGEFLAEERYEAWAEELRQSYRTMYSEALHRLSLYYFERGEHAMAVLHCQRILAQEPCDEEAHLLLMRSYVAQGLRHLAVRQYQICSNALRTELGLTPSEDVESFYRRVVAVE